MTDLEMTKLCAEAMGLCESCAYNPLRDDAQCFALVKRFLLDIEGYSKYWCVLFDDAYGHAKAKHADLNRAIVECVAKMQAAK